LRFTQEFAAAKDHPVLRAGTQYKGNLTRSFAFSDSIVRVRPYDAEYNDGSLFHEIIALVHAQADLSHHGIFIRGGVAVGKIVFEKNAVFGPALVRAYDLESQYANVPRIIIGPEVFHELRRNAKLRAEHHELTHEIHYIKKLVRRGDDGLWFVDYLKAFVSEMGEPTQYPQFIGVTATGLPPMLTNSRSKDARCKSTCGSLNTTTASVANAAMPLPISR